MMIFLFVILIMIGLPLWLWLMSRISQISHAGALLSLFLILPAFYWVFKLWHDKRADLQMVALANLVVNAIALPAVILYSTHYAVSQANEASAPKDNPSMAQWCKEQNDAVYDPVLQVCVEPSKAQAAAQEHADNLMGQLEQHINQRGIAGELDRSITPDIATFKNSPDIVDAASYHFLPLSTSQRPITLLLCVSETACTDFDGQQKAGNINTTFVRGKLMLLIPPDTVDAGILKKLKSAMAKFKPKAP